MMSATRKTKNDADFLEAGNMTSNDCVSESLEVSLTFLWQPDIFAESIADFFAAATHCSPSLS